MRFLIAIALSVAVLAEPVGATLLAALVLLAAAALIVGAVLWLRSTGDERDDRFYKIYFVNQSLEGMQIRSDVKMRGIRVGAVTGFRISTRHPGAVEVVIRVDAATNFFPTPGIEVRRGMSPAWTARRATTWACSPR